MLDFLVLTLSLTIAIIVSGIILTAATFTLMMSPKAMKWMTKAYMKMLERTLKDFDEDLDKKLGA